MHFTRLTLSGFKSFVDATDLLIEPGLTGIVGPNGCGKSNIIEALRWVMGENAPKNLRGGEMEEVIFAGTRDRPARNIAEVSLHLDNSMRAASSAFNDADEICVSRKIERGAGSSYRINAKPVRAKDVQILFADQATGAHSPALVGQGRIGALIQSNPKERRQLLEEAAGIAGLHARRHESELKMRAADRNLERLDDLLAGLETQVQGLKKQARQATRFSNVSNDIRTHRARIFAIEAHELETKLEVANEKMKAATMQLSKLTQALAQQTTQHTNLTADLPAKRDAQAKAAAVYQRLTIQLEQLQTETKDITARLADAQNRKTQAEQDLNIEEQRLAEAKDSIANLSEEREDLTKNQKNLQAKLATARQDLDQQNEMLTQTQQVLDQHQQLLATTQAEATSAQNQINFLTQRRDQLAQTHDRLSQRMISQQQIDQAKQEGNELEQKIGQIRKDIEQTEKQYTASLAAREKAEQTYQKGKNDLDEHTRHITRLEAEHETLTRLLAPPKQATKTAAQPVIDLLNVQTGYEKALSAALGDALNASIDPSDPAHWSKLGASAKKPAFNDKIEPLDKYVSGADELNRALAQIGIIDPSQIDAYWPDLQEGQLLVSKDGHIWRWDGYYKGPDAQDKLHQRLEHRNRLRQIDDQLTKLTKKEESLSARLQDMLKNSEELKQTCLNIQNKTADLTRQHDLHQADYKRLQTDCMRLADEYQSQQTQLSELAETQKKIDQELATAQEKLAQSSDLEDHKKQTEILQKNLSDQRDASRQAETLVNSLTHEIDASSRRYQQIGKEIERADHTLKSGSLRIAQLRDRRLEASNQLEKMAKRPDQIDQERDKLQDQISLAETKRSACADDLQSLENKLREIETNLKQTQTQERSASDDKLRAEHDIQTITQAAESLNARIKETLDITLGKIGSMADIDPADTEFDLVRQKMKYEDKLARLISERDNMGPVNLRAEIEREEIANEIDRLTAERSDLIQAMEKLRSAISTLNREARGRLKDAYHTVNAHFGEIFQDLFGGGKAHLSLVEGDDPLTAGIEIQASPPGKRLQNMSLLSGGEQALTAMALIFAVFLTNPAPICILDEVDAPLDEANVARFCGLIDKIAGKTKTRFLIVTHHRLTMARMQRLYGITMSEQGVSQLVSVDLSTAEMLRETEIKVTA